MPKSVGAHTEKRLTDRTIRSLKKPGRHTDGGGLYLDVRANGRKHFLCRFRVNGKSIDRRIGQYPDLSLAQARERTQALRTELRHGVADEDVEDVALPTFEEVARAAHRDLTHGLKNEKHRAQWITTLERYAFPLVGQKPIDAVTRQDVGNVLRPIWKEKNETAQRVRGRMRMVMEYAEAHHDLNLPNLFPNPRLMFPSVPRRRNHHAAMGRDEIEAFYKALSDRRAQSSALALRFTILTACRTSEVLHMKWEELDLGHRSGPLWIIPAERMKAGAEHRVPLSDEAIAILDQARHTHGDSGYVFPGQKAGRPMSNMTMLKLLRNLSGERYTVHGFRSTFCDWVAEETPTPHFVRERALAHTIENEAERAYQRGDLLEKRRKLMQDWANFVSGASSAPKTHLSNSRRADRLVPMCEVTRV